MLQKPDRNHPAGEVSHLADAVDFILRSYRPVVTTEMCDIDAALGRVLARDLPALVSLPRFDAAAVDGYALRAADISPSAPSRLHVAGRSAAGHPDDRPLRPGEAARIFTGAAVPAGADLVLMQEECQRDGAWLRVPAHNRGRANIRQVGEDIRLGDTALLAGTRLGSGHLALAAALGYPALPVNRRLKVALFSTGDELAAGGGQVPAGHIIDANRPLLRGLLAQAGCAVDDRGILRDSADAQIESLVLAARDNDLIITSGGMSVGEEDHLPGVIRRRGHLEIWRLKIKPGKPVGIGDIDDCPILALPGNPMAAAVTFLMLGVPLIASLCGSRDVCPPVLHLPVSREIAKRPGRWEAFAARLVQVPGKGSHVEPLRKGGSAMLSSLAGADGFIGLPEPAEWVAGGDLVPFFPLN